MTIAIFIIVLLEYGLAIMVINWIAFREHPPAGRATRLTIAAWAAWSAIFAMRATTAEQLLLQPLFFAVPGVPVGLFIYWRLKKKHDREAVNWRDFQ